MSHGSTMFSFTYSIVTDETKSGPGHFYIRTVFSRKSSSMNSFWCIFFLIKSLRNEYYDLTTPRDECVFIHAPTSKYAHIAHNDYWTSFMRWPNVVGLYLKLWHMQNGSNPCASPLTLCFHHKYIYVIPWTIDTDSKWSCLFNMNGAIVVGDDGEW